MSPPNAAPNARERFPVLDDDPAGGAHYAPGSRFGLGERRDLSSHRLRHGGVSAEPVVSCLPALHGPGPVAEARLPARTPGVGRLAVCPRPGCIQPPARPDGPVRALERPISRRNSGGHDRPGESEATSFRSGLPGSAGHDEAPEHVGSGGGTGFGADCRAERARRPDRSAQPSSSRSSRVLTSGFEYRRISPAKR